MGNRIWPAEVHAVVAAHLEAVDAAMVRGRMPLDERRAITAEIESHIWTELSTHAAMTADAAREVIAQLDSPEAYAGGSAAVCEGDGTRRVPTVLWWAAAFAVAPVFFPLIKWTVVENPTFHRTFAPLVTDDATPTHVRFGMFLVWLLCVVLMLASVVGPVLATVMGLTAVGKIQRPEQRTYWGLKRAAFVSLLYPVLAIDLLLFWAVWHGVRGVKGVTFMHDVPHDRMLVLWGAVFACIVVDVVFVRWAYAAFRDNRFPGPMPEGQRRKLEARKLAAA